MTNKKGAVEMTKMIAVLISMILLFQLSVLAQNHSKVIPTPNAAVGYLMAISWMEPGSETVLKELSAAETIEDLAKLSPNAKKYISQTNLSTAIAWLVQGAACEQCQFGYERTYLPNEPFPPFMRLRQFAHAARVFGLQQLDDGKFAEALQTFKAIFQLGNHLQGDGPLISYVIGFAIQKIAIKSFEELLAQDKEEKITLAAREFLKSQEDTALIVKKSIAGEKKIMAAALEMMKNDQRSSEVLAPDWRELRTWLPKYSGKKEYVTLPPYSSDEKYSKNHPSVLSADTLSEMEEFKRFMKSQEFDMMIVEALSMFDKAIALDPYASDYDEKLQIFNQRIENSTNTVILKAMPNIAKVYEKQIELDEMIKRLLEK